MDPYGVMMALMMLAIVCGGLWFARRTCRQAAQNAQRRADKRQLLRERFAQMQTGITLAQARELLEDIEGVTAADLVTQSEQEGKLTQQYIWYLGSELDYETEDDDSYVVSMGHQPGSGGQLVRGLPVGGGANMGYQPGSGGRLAMALPVADGGTVHRACICALFEDGRLIAREQDGLSKTQA